MSAAPALKPDETEPSAQQTPQPDRRQTESPPISPPAEDVSEQDVQNFNLDAAIEGLRNAKSEMTRPEGANHQAETKAHVWDIPIEMEVIIGTLSLTVSDLLSMEVDAIYPLAQRTSEPLKLLAGGKVLGQCELIAPEQEGEALAIRIVNLSASNKPDLPSQ